MFFWQQDDCGCRKHRYRNMKKSPTMRNHYKSTANQKDTQQLFLGVYHLNGHCQSDRVYGPTKDSRFSLISSRHRVNVSQKTWIGDRRRRIYGFQGAAKFLGCFVCGGPCGIVASPGVRIKFASLTFHRIQHCARSKTAQLLQVRYFFNRPRDAAEV